MGCECACWSMLRYATLRRSICGEYLGPLHRLMSSAQHPHNAPKSEPHLRAPRRDCRQCPAGHPGWLRAPSIDRCTYAERCNGLCWTRRNCGSDYLASCHDHDITTSRPLLLRATSVIDLPDTLHPECMPDLSYQHLPRHTSQRSRDSSIASYARQPEIHLDRHLLHERSVSSQTDSRDHHGTSRWQPSSR